MKHRTLIEMLAFITVALLVIVLYFSGFSVFAQTYNMNFDVYNIGSITRSEDTSDSYDIFIGPDDTTYDYIWQVYSPHFYFNADVDGLVDVSSCGCYIMSGAGSYVQGFYMPDDTIIIYDEYGYGKILCKKDNYDSVMVNDNNLIQGDFYAEYTSSGYTGLSNNYTIDSEQYVGSAHLNNFKVLSSNCAIYQVPDVDLFTSFDEVIGDNVNPNYQGGSSDSDIRLAFNPNSLYTYINSDWSGNVVTDVGVSEEQKKLNTQYGINFNYTFNIDIKGVRQVFDENYAVESANLWKIYEVTYHGSGNYVIPLNSFNNGHCELSNSLVFSLIRGSLSLKSNITNQSYNYTNVTFLDVINILGLKNMPFVSKDSGSLGVSVKGVSLSLPFDDSSSWEQFDFSYSSVPTCNTITGGGMYFNYSAVSGSVNYSTTMPDMNAVQKEISNYNNDNGYTPDSDNYINPSNYLPSNTDSNGLIGGNSNSSATSGGSIAYGSNVNNSVIVNTGQDAKEVINYAKNELLPANYEGGYVEKLETVTDSNNFIQYMSTTFSFMPQTFWNDVAYYGKIALIILVSGFILSLVRRLIT